MYFQDNDVHVFRDGLLPGLILENCNTFHCQSFDMPVCLLSKAGFTIEKYHLQAVKFCKIISCFTKLWPNTESDLSISLRTIQPAYKPQDISKVPAFVGEE